MASPVKAFIAATALAAATITPLSQSYADDRGFRHYHGKNWDGPKRHYHKHKHRHKRHRGPVVIEQYNNDDALLLGVLGLAAGAIITGALLSNPANQPSYDPGPHPGHAPPAQDYYPPAPTVSDYPPAPSGPYAGGGIEPWTDEWFRYCANKYRSFNAATGTYRGYDGYNHFCVVR